MINLKHDKSIKNTCHYAAPPCCFYWNAYLGQVLNKVWFFPACELGGRKFWGVQTNKLATTVILVALLLTKVTSWFNELSALQVSAPSLPYLGVSFANRYFVLYLAISILLNNWYIMMHKKKVSTRICTKT